jgi:hypothetical protein
MRVVRAFQKIMSTVRTSHRAAKKEDWQGKAKQKKTIIEPTTKMIEKELQ